MDVRVLTDLQTGPSINLLETDGETLVWAEEDFVTLSLTQLAPHASSCRPLRLYNHCWRQAPLTALCLGTGRLGSSDPRPQDTAEQPLVVAANKYAVVVWRVRALHAAMSRGEKLPEGMPALTGMGPVDAVALSRSEAAGNANMLAVCAGTCVHVIELATLNHVYRLEGHAAPVLCAAFCEPHCPHWLVTAGEDRCLMVWDLQEGSLVYQSPILTASALTSIAVDPSYLRVVVGAADGVLRFFDLAAAPACRCLQVFDLVKQLQRTADQAAAVGTIAVAAAASGPKVVRAQPAWKRQFQEQEAMMQQAQESSLTESQDELHQSSSTAVLRLHYSSLRTPLPDGDTGLLAEAPRLLAGSMRALAILDSSAYTVLQSHFFRAAGIPPAYQPSKDSIAQHLPDVSAARAFAFGLDRHSTCLFCCVAHTEGICVLRLVPSALPGMAELAAHEEAQRYGPGLSDAPPLPRETDAPELDVDCDGAAIGARGVTAGGRLCSIAEEQGFVGGRKQWSGSEAGYEKEGGKGLRGGVGRGDHGREKWGAEGSTGLKGAVGMKGVLGNKIDGPEGQGGAVKGGGLGRTGSSGRGVSGVNKDVNKAGGVGQGVGAGSGPRVHAGVMESLLLTVFQTRPLPEGSPLRDPSLKPIPPPAGLPRSNSTPTPSANAGSKAMGGASRGGRVHSASPMRNRGAAKQQPIVFHKQIKSSGYGYVQPHVKLGRPPPPPVKLPTQPIPTSNVSRHLLQARSYPVNCDPPLVPQHRNCLPNGTPVHHGTITRLRYSSDASRLLTVSTDKTARVMRLPLSKYQGEGTDLLAHNAGLLSGDWSMDGTMVLTASADRSARLWNASCAHPLMHLSNATHNASLKAAQPSTSITAAGSAYPSASPCAMLPKRAALPASQRALSPSAGNPPFLHEVSAARFYYQDQFILLSSGNRINLYRYKLAAGDLTDDIARLKATSKYRLAASYTSSAQSIHDVSAINSFLSPVALLAGSNRCIDAVDCSTMQTAASMQDAHARPVHTIVQSANTSLYTSHPREASELFATMACDGALKMWDLRVCRCVRTFSGHQNSQIPVGAAFSPCLRYLACGSEDQAAYVYDIRQGTVLSRLGRHGSAVTDVAFNPLHPQLAVASQGGHVHFYSDDGC